MALEDGLEQLKGETTESVSEGNHNLSDSALEDELQKGLQSLSVEVEAGADVGEDSVGGVAASEVLDLALEVFFLVRRADPGVDDLLFPVVCASSVVAAIAEEPEDVVVQVEPLSSWQSLALDPSLVGPATEAGVGDVIALTDVLRGDIHGPPASVADFEVAIMRDVPKSAIFNVLSVSPNEKRRIVVFFMTRYFFFHKRLSRVLGEKNHFCLKCEKLCNGKKKLVFVFFWG